MTITRHLDDATLMSFAAGGLPEALAAVAAAHVAMCPRCAGEVRSLERVGACFLEALEPEPVGPPAAVAARAVPAASSGAVAALLGSDFDAVRWRWLAIGVWHMRVPLSPGAKGSLRLLKVAPGQTIPEHGHEGSELTLVLRGSYSDETGCYGAGDVADLDEEIEHRPRAHPETGCVCLLASEKLSRFKGIVPRLIQPFTRV